MIETSRVISMQCVCCGAKLDIANDMYTFACGYCGNHLSVERRGGTVALRHVVDAIQKVQAGTDKMAVELALARLEKEREKVREQLKSVDDECSWRVVAVDQKSKMIWKIGLAISFAAAVVLRNSTISYSHINLNSENPFETPPDPVTNFFYFLIALMALGSIGLSFWYRKQSREACSHEWVQVRAPILGEIAALNSEIERNKAIVNA